MTRNERDILIFATIGAGVGISNWITDASDFTKTLSTAYLVGFFAFYIIIREISRVYDEVRLLRNLMWEISFRTPIKDEDREEIKKQIDELEKRYK
jgi:hypothetical protein